MSIFDLVGKLVKKKFGKPEEKTAHERYMELRLEAEEMALQSGVDFRSAYYLPFKPLIEAMGQNNAMRFMDLREEMEKLYVQLSTIEQRHWSLKRDDKDLFSDL